MKPLDIVIPDGSMQEVILNLLAKAGLVVKVEKKRTKEGKVAVDWIKRIAFQRPQEIPHYLKNDHFDVGIVGEDWLANWGYKFPILLKLNIGRSGNKSVKIVLAVKESSQIQKVEDLPAWAEVATEYVQLTEKFFQKRKLTDIRVIPSYGNTEHKVQFGADAIVDVSESGASLKENDLRVICEIMESHTVVAVNPKAFEDPEKKPYIDCFVRLLKGAFQASQYVLLIANVPKKAIKEASKIIGGLKGPSRSPLMKKDWYSLESFVLREEEQRIIFELLQIGVTDIAVNRDIPLIMS